MSNNTFPHCDPRVIHAPADNCKFCNESILQKAREIWGIAYTGHPESGKIPCPGETARGMDSLNSWGGNVAYTPEVKKKRKEQWAAIEADLTKFYLRNNLPVEVKSQIEELGRLVDLD